MYKKIKILMLGDCVLSPSGIGTQLKYISEGLVRTGKYQLIQLGGAIKHENMNPIKFHEYGDDWIIFPVEGYGNQEIIRSIVRTHKPDILFFFTDPRFFYWLWQIENEIRPLVPMLYYHVWDNFPYPRFNKSLYNSTDVIATISKVTHDIVKTVSPNTEELYLPHSVNTDIFRKYEPNEPIRMGTDPNNQPVYTTLNKFKNENLIKEKDKMVFFWNNRNARRKQSGTVIWWFKEFLDQVGHDKACLIMHTEAKDPNGQDLEVIIRDLGLDSSGAVKISQVKVPAENLAILYNSMDCVINISDAEGFGLSTLESLACETPIIVNMTGGLQEQVTDYSSVDITEQFMLKRNVEKKGITVYEHGIGIEPSSKAVIGSQEVPFIDEDRINKDDFIKALKTMYEMSPEQRKAMGKKGREHVLKNYNFQNYLKSWDDLMTKTYQSLGSWENRVGYRSFELRTL